MHDLSSTNDGQAMFAFNDREDPWHRLGTPVRGYMSLDEALMASHTDYVVTERPIYIMTADGPQVIESKKATVRTETILGDAGFEDITHTLGVVGTNYAIEQNAATAEWAYDLAGVSNGDAVVDTIGALGNGNEFFVLLDLGQITLDPSGLNDTIQRYLVVRNSHDGSQSLNAFDTNVRVVCRNTLEMAAGGRKSRTVKIRHTSGKDDRKAQAIHTLGLARAAQDAFVSQATKMMQTPATRGDLIKVVEAIWTKPEATATKAVQTKWANRMDTIDVVYNRPTNDVGNTMWQVYNVLTEYLDWDRPVRGTTDRSAASADPEGAVAAMKSKVAQLVLA